MYFIVKRASPRYHQLTLEELYTAAEDYVPMAANDPSATVTIKRDSVPQNQKLKNKLIAVLANYNERYDELRKKDRKSLYTEFRIPKRSGGLRTIDAPVPELKTALYELKAIFEEQFKASYHTSAFAYVKHRCNVDAIKKHQQNESKWFAKYDFSDFFGSVNPDYVMRIMGMIYPFNYVIEDEAGRKEMERAIDLAFLDGKLPQGTPLSPMLTNLIMIPIDYTLSNALRDYLDNRYVYTRYADDMIISSRYYFSLGYITDLIERTIIAFNAPFKLNHKKTRLGSSAGSNYNLGVMLNKDNEITIGRKRLRQLESMIYQFATDTKSGNMWPKDDVQHLSGLISYYQMVYKKSNEDGPTVIDRVLDHYSKKLDFGVREAMASMLRN